MDIPNDMVFKILKIFIANGPKTADYAINLYDKPPEYIRAYYEGRKSVYTDLEDFLGYYEKISNN